MPDFKKAKIYKLWCYETDDIYIGSTCQRLCARLSGHKRQNDGCTSKKLFEISDNVMIELIEEYPCNNKMELNRRESHFIKELNCINKRIENRTKKEYLEENADYFKEKRKKYYEKNADKIKEYQKQYNLDNRDKVLELQKQYRENNRDKIKAHKKEYYEKNADKINEKGREKVKCECGCIITRNTLLQHRKNTKHLNLLNA
jgi:hypothetical protein